MNNNSLSHRNSKHNKSTIMLVSGELDKALLAFDIAIGHAAMGKEVTMWFTLYGVNCLKKPRTLFSYEKWLVRKKNIGSGRNIKTDHFLQNIIRLLNRDGANHQPLSQLNFWGLGPRILSLIMRSKGIPNLQELIMYAHDMEIKFRICQICVDALALNVEDDLLVPAEVLGVSTYTIDTMNSDYNVVI